MLGKGGWGVGEDNGLVMWKQVGWGITVLRGKLCQGGGRCCCL